MNEYEQEIESLREFCRQYQMEIAELKESNFNLNLKVEIYEASIKVFAELQQKNAALRKQVEELQKFTVDCANGGFVYAASKNGEI